MKLVQQTFTLLTLRERPIGIWILSSFTAALGLLIFIAYNSPVDLLGLFCITCANLMMFGSPVKTCLFDKNRNRVTFKQKGWLGNKAISYPINKITGVQVEPINLLGIKFYRLSLRLLSGEQFYLTPIPTTDWKLQKKLASYIQQFLI